MDRSTKELFFAFPLNPSDVEADHCMMYRPWGTRTLKIKVSTNKDMPKLWVRPQGVLPEEMELGIHKAYADDSDAFHVTWGGGHELGPCVKTKDLLGVFEKCVPLGANESSTIFFNVTHAGLELPSEAMLTLKAFENVGDNSEKDRRDRASLSIKLQKPANMPAEEEIMRLVPGELDNTWVVSPGQYLPAYDSRWWPSSLVSYESSEQLPLSLRIEEGKLLVLWNDGATTIAVIEDYTNPSVLLMAETLAFDLFSFDEWSVVLRVWFFWVDRYIGGKHFVGRHEVPDAERFDMIIRRKDGRVLLACTDLHWREVWSRVLPKKILRATLGMPRESTIKLAQQKWSETWNDIWVRPAKLLSKGKEIEHQNNPVDPYIRRLAAREATVTLKARGTEAHLPTLHNVEQRRPPRMTSSDVRLG